MATLPTLTVNGNSVNGPRNWGGQDYTAIDETGASDASRCFGASKVSANDTSFLIQDMPADFISMSTFTIEVNCARSSTTDDTVQLQARVLIDSTNSVLAQSTGGFHATLVSHGRDGNIDGTGATFNTYTHTFTYLDTTAGKAAWDDARLELRQNYQATMGGDTTAYVVVEWVRFTGTYTAVPSAPTGLTAGTPGQTTMPLSWTAPATGEIPTGYQYRYRISGTVPELVIGASSNKTYALVGGDVLRQSFIATHSTLTSIKIQSLNSTIATPIKILSSALVELSSGSLVAGSGTNRTYTLPSTIALTVGETYWVQFGGDAFGFDINGYNIDVYSGGNAQLNGTNLAEDVSITINPGGVSAPWSAWTSTGAGTATSHTVTELVADTEYEFQVRATNAIGGGPESNTVTATTAAGGGGGTDSNPMQLRPLTTVRQAVARSSGW